MTISMARRMLLHELRSAETDRQGKTIVSHAGDNHHSCLKTELKFGMGYEWSPDSLQLTIMGYGHARYGHL